MSLIIVAIILVLVSVVSFLITAGIIKVITLLLGLAFSWKIALVVWLILFLISMFVKSNK